MATSESLRAERSADLDPAPAAPAPASEYLKRHLLTRALKGAAPPAGFVFRYRLFDDGSLMVEVIRNRDGLPAEYPLFGAVVPRHELLRRPTA